MKTLTVNARISLAIGCMIAVVVVGGNMGFWGLKYSISRSQAIHAVAGQKALFVSESTRLALSARAHFEQEAQALKDVILGGADNSAVKSSWAQFEQKAALVEQDLAALRDLAQKAKAEPAPVENALRAHRNSTAEFRDALKAWDPGKPGTIPLSLPTSPRVIVDSF